MKTALLLVALCLQEEGVVRDRTDFIPDADQPRPVAAGRHVMALVPRALLPLDPGAVRPEDGRLMLSASGGGYRWCYVTLPTGKVDLATVLNTDGFGVESRFSLVEVDVVERQGSPNGVPALVARSMKVVDNSKDFPLRPHKVVAEMRTKYEAWRKDQDKAVAEAMERSRKEAKGDANRTKPARTATIMHVQWMEETLKLQVRFLTRVLTTDEVPRDYSGPRVGNPPAPSKIWWGVDFGALYEVDRSGALEKRLTLPMETWHGGFPPKPALAWNDYK